MNNKEDQMPIRRLNFGESTCEPEMLPRLFRNMIMIISDHKWYFSVKTDDTLTGKDQ